uniref:Mannosyl-oligosaccharide 1,2-alpha-mannosidase MNS1 isoform X1 n=1 Tax=Elaeis guineensis var. tenera TaxID=51953 RepID=A0A8N4IEZ1_ELAGV|nr:mannosyl-oligosaccharide 1,2-alpha-mannosidase MNS1 isoform X1 [Elaeis guineensis]
MSSSTSGRWRYRRPSYDLKRPRRMALVSIVFVVVTFGLCDRQSMVRKHGAEVSKINEELYQLQDQLQNIEDDLWNSGEVIVGIVGKLSNVDLVYHDPNDNQHRKSERGYASCMEFLWNAWAQDELQILQVMLLVIHLVNNSSPRNTSCWRWDDSGGFL